jgi:hypothetical protein
MKNSIIYLALIGGLIFTTSLQNHKGNTNDVYNTEKVMLHPELVDGPEFVDESLEKYAAFDTKDKLYEAFGAAAIKDGATTPAGEDTRMSSSLTDPRNGKVYNYVWNKNGESLYLIESYYRVLKENDTEKQRQIVDYKEGLYTGMTVSDLQKWNGAPFKFAGLSRDGGGMVTFESNSGYDIIVKIGLDKSLKNKAPRSVKNKKMISSDSKVAQKTPLFVDYIALKVRK